MGKKSLLFFSGLFFILVILSQAQPVRPSVWAGKFYPANPIQLRQMINQWLAESPIHEEIKNLRALIVPHAGYPYSGKVAAQAYRQVKGKDYTAVIIMGPSHHYGFRGVSIDTEARYRTPLGELEVDTHLARQLAQLTGYKTISAAHQQEHSIEVQLPFLQVVLPQVRIVPVVFGYPDQKDVNNMAQALAKIMTNPRILIIATTDLSHYLPKTKANQTDTQTIKLIKKFKGTTLLRKALRGANIMCGVAPVSALLMASQRLAHPQIHILDYRDSSAAGGPTDRVVGYLAAVIEAALPSSPKTEASPSFDLSPSEKQQLLQLAREAITLFLREKKLPDYSPSSPRLWEKKGAFVTLRKKGHLRGCIGFIESNLPLYQTVIQAAIYAAVKDLRFQPVSLEELKEINIEISILSPLKKIRHPAQIQVGRHGLVIEKGNHKGLLLPQVATENGWDSLTFLQQVCLKAGLPPDAWRQGAHLYTFEALVFAEK